MCDQLIRFIIALMQASEITTHINSHKLFSSAVMETLRLEIDDLGIDNLIGPGISRQLWLAWPKPGHISMGVGPLPGVHTLFDKIISEDFGLEMHAVGFESGGSYGSGDKQLKRGDWLFADDGGQFLVSVSVFLAPTTFIS